MVCKTVSIVVNKGYAGEAEVKADIVEYVAAPEWAKAERGSAVRARAGEVRP